MSSTHTQPAIRAGMYTVDHDHSSVGFEVKHMVVATFRGQFDRYDAQLVSDEAGIAIDGVVDVASIAVRNPALEAHLMSSEFFDSERHPQLRFVSTTVRGTGDEIEVDGELTVRGIALPVTAHGSLSEPTEDAFGVTRLGLELEAVIDRTAYGLRWNMPLPKGGFALADDVRLAVRLSMTEQAS